MSRYQPVLPGQPLSPTFLIVCGETTAAAGSQADITIILKPGVSLSAVRMTRRKTDRSEYLNIEVNQSTTVEVK